MREQAVLEYNLVISNNDEDDEATEDLLEKLRKLIVNVDALLKNEASAAAPQESAATPEAAPMNAPTHPAMAPGMDMGAPPIAPAPAGLEGGMEQALAGLL